MDEDVGARRVRLALLSVVVLVFGLLAVGAATWVDRQRSDPEPDTVAGPGTVDGGQADPQGGAATTTVPSTVPPTSTTRGPLGSGETVTIAFAGDSYAEGVLRQRLDTRPQDFVGPYAATFQAADLTVINLETALTEGGRAHDKDFTFRAPGRVLDALRAGGVDVASMANNHGMDFGLSGLEDSVAIKRAQADGMVIGIGLDEDEAYAPYVTEIKGQRIGVFAATQVLDSSLLELWTAGPGKPGLASAKRADRLAAEIQRWRSELDTVVVMVHWGVEGETCPTDVQQTLARQLVDAGADIIVGGHQHRVAGGGRMGDALIHYGLGNFLFRANSPAGARTGVLVAEVTGRRIERYQWEPGRIADSIPTPLTGAERDAGVAEWEALRSCTGLAA